MTNLNTYKRPYPWFGGKHRIAGAVWRRFGKIRNYVEPFFGGGAVLLARPDFDPAHPPTETVNDINAWLCNFWRAVKAEPDAVAEFAADPVSELDLHARGGGSSTGAELTASSSRRCGQTLNGMTRSRPGGGCGAKAAGSQADGDENPVVIPSHVQFPF